ncbi:MAG: hypothetical protein PHW63_05175 [Alphaproteobacteria bacterium]|nr:hypothetical protein [Alphaproteobacteria bacterium]
MTRRRLVLYIAPVGATLFLPRKGGLPPTLLSCDRDNEAGNATLDAALALYARHPLTLLVDTPDILFKKTSLPRGLSFWDRRKLLARRLDLAFPHTPYKAMAARGTDMALFVALEGNETVAYWTERLRPFRALPFSLALLPLELHRLLHDKAPTGWTLDLLLTQHGGLRLTAFKEGLPLLSRQIPLDGSPDEQRDGLADEIDRTLAFLPRLGLQADDPVRLSGLLPTFLHGGIKKITTTQSITSCLLTPQAFIQKRHLAFKPSEDMAPAEALLLLGLPHKRHPFALELWTEEESRTRRDKLIHQSMTAMGALCLGLAMLMAGATIYSLAQAYKTNEQIRTQTSALQQDFLNRRTTMEQETATLSRLRQAAERRKLYAKSEAPLASVLPALRDHLPSDLQLTQIELSGNTLSLMIKGEDEPDLPPLQQALGKALPAFKISLRRTASSSPTATGDEHAP